MRATESVLLACLVCFSGSALAQAAEQEPVAVLEFGGAGSWDVKGGSSFGPTVAAEVTPIENWLELEAGVTPLFGNGAIEWDSDLLFKKPWTLSKKVEFMAGVGPEWVHTRQPGMAANSISEYLALDFMFGPRRSTGSAGTWSRSSITTLVEGTSSRWASAGAC